VSSDTTQARFPATSGDIVADAMDPMMEMVLGSRLKFDERLDPELLARASRLLLDLEPVLGCWWDEKSRGADWVRCTRLDEWTVFSMADSEDPDRDFATFHGTPFEPRGPRLAVLLLRSRDHDDLCVRFDHVAGDGWSAKEVTHLLADVYSRLFDDPDYVPPPRTSPRPDHADVWKALTEEQRQLAAANPPSMTNMSQWKMKTRPGATDCLAVRALTLSPVRVAALRAYAHARGATVNDALISALIRAVESNNPQRPGLKPGVSISADTRRFAGETGLERLANIATTQTVRMDFRHGETFDDTLRHVIEAVKPYKDTLWNVGPTSDEKPSPRTMRAIFWFAATALRVSRAAAMVTMNVGPFDEERLVFGVARPVSAVVTGPVGRYAGFPLLISYYQGALTLWTGFREKFISSELVERHLANIDGQLADVVGAPAGRSPETAAG